MVWKDWFVPKWKHSDPSVRSAAVAELVDPQALDKVLLEEEVESIRLAAVARVTDSSVLLRVAEQDAALAVRRVAVERLTEVAPLATVVERAADVELQRVAASRMLTLEAPEGASELMKLLYRLEGDARIPIITALGAHGDARHADALAHLLDQASDESDIAETLAQALERLGDVRGDNWLEAQAAVASGDVAGLESFKRVHGLLAILARHGDDERRLAACHALERLGGVTAIEGLVANLGDRKLSFEIGKSLDEIGPSVLPSLLRALRHGPAPQREMAAWTLGRMVERDRVRKDPAVIDTLEHAASDTETMVRAYTAGALLHFPTRGVPLLRQLSQDPDIRVQASSKAALLHLQDSCDSCGGPGAGRAARGAVSMTLVCPACGHAERDAPISEIVAQVRRGRSQTLTCSACNTASLHVGPAMICYECHFLSGDVDSLMAAHWRTHGASVARRPRKTIEMRSLSDLGASSVPRAKRKERLIGTKMGRYVLVRNASTGTEGAAPLAPFLAEAGGTDKAVKAAVKAVRAGEVSVDEWLARELRKHPERASPSPWKLPIDVQALRDHVGSPGEARQAMIKLLVEWEQSIRDAGVADAGTPERDAQDQSFIDRVVALAHEWGLEFDGPAAAALFLETSEGREERYYGARWTLLY